MHMTPSLLWTLEEIGQLVSGSGNPSETLTNIVNLIQQRFVTDVCSVYLLEPDRTTLVLAATIGLRPESVGRVKMRITEGLAGLVSLQAGLQEAVLRPAAPRVLPRAVAQNPPSSTSEFAISAAAIIRRTDGTRTSATTSWIFGAARAASSSIRRR